ncbi:mechanosensitive ion channel domain-containing protein [Enterobacter hormaechei]
MPTSFSDLIILFEKPIRIGDTGPSAISPAASPINTRAPTISDWDRKEIIVPTRRLAGAVYQLVAVRLRHACGADRTAPSDANSEEVTQSCIRLLNAVRW